MRRYAAIAIMSLSATVAFAQKGKDADDKRVQKTNEEIVSIYKSQVDMNNELDKVSYSLGVNLAQNLKTQGLENINVAALGKGLSAAMNGEETEISEMEAQQILQAYFQKKMEEKATAAKQKGTDFLAENAKRKEVVTLPSGLQYEILKEGEGPKPGPADKVTVHYHGTLIDGTVFDSSVQRGQPATFGVNQVIKGWTEALQLMPQGSKWKLYIPSDLAYGDRGAGQAIGPHETLVFEVDLISIEGK